MSTPTRLAADLQSRLAHAIAQRAIQVCFQPIVDAQTQRVVSCEVVPCWQDAIHGHVPPRTFMPVAQQLGLLEELGLQLWSHALACLHAWRSSGRRITLLANVSRQPFHTGAFMVQLSSDLGRLGISQSCIDLEISENITSEVGSCTFQRMTELREAGFGVVIGEFGSGKSIASRLTGKPASGVRIDATLTRQAQGKLGAETIETIVKVAQISNLQTFASGVEDAETAALLALMGVQRLQGRYFGEPMDRHRFENFLAQDGYAF